MELSTSDTYMRWATGVKEALTETQECSNAKSKMSKTKSSIIQDSYV